MTVAAIGLLLTVVGLAHGEYGFAGFGVALALFGLLLDLTRLP